MFDSGLYYSFTLLDDNWPVTDSRLVFSSVETDYQNIVRSSVLNTETEFSNVSSKRGMIERFTYPF